MAREPWLKELPASRMVYPTAFVDRIKYWIWRLYSPLHPIVRYSCKYLGISADMFNPPSGRDGRQDYLIGRVDPEKSLRDMVEYLIGLGYANHFIAWIDRGEVVSLRKNIDFRYQYHIRIFNDGEVRCHFEYTPEYKPLQHFFQIGFEDRTDEFKEILKDWIIEAE